MDIADDLQRSLDELTQARELARELLEITDTLGAVKHLMLRAFTGMLESAGLEPKTLAGVLDEALPELIALIVPAVLELYTLDELRALVELHSNPVMRKHLANREALSAAVETAAGPWGARFERRLDKAFGK